MSPRALSRRWARALSALALLPILMAGHEMAQARAPIAAAAWLAGCWSADGKDAGSAEQWMAPAGGSMLGLSCTVRGDQTAAFEFMQIREQADAGLVFIAAPSGQRETRCALTRNETGMLVFESPEHDFPQTVIYRPASAGRLLARIEGLRSGTLRGIDFPMTRVPCDGPPAALR